jgi:hypothetical protein
LFEHREKIVAQPVAPGENRLARGPHRSLCLSRAEVQVMKILDEGFGVRRWEPALAEAGVDFKTLAGERKAGAVLGERPKARCGFVSAKKAET